MDNINLVGQESNSNNTLTFSSNYNSLSNDRNENYRNSTEIIQQNSINNSNNNTKKDAYQNNYQNPSTRISLLGDVVKINE